MTELPAFKCGTDSRSLLIESISNYTTSVTAETGDFHVSGLVMINLLGKNNLNFKTRTLLDTGSGTNFVSSDILSKLKYDHITTKDLKVTGINSTETKKYDLVRIFIDCENCPVKSIRCYTIPGFPSYSIDKSAFNQIILECKQLPNLSNPLANEADHGEGIGLILGPGTIRDISEKPPSYYKSYLVDHTFFGPALSGRLPTNQPISSYTVGLHRFTDKVADADQSYFLNESKIDEKIKLLENLQFLSDKEILGVRENEMHNNDKICLEKFKAEVKYDIDNKRYIVALPFNQNKFNLASNKWIALKRAQALQRCFILDKNYGVMYAQQIQKLLLSDFIEEVTGETEVGDVIHYLPHRGIRKVDNQTTSLRIVMDASCKANASSLSLNDCLYTGPNLIVGMCFLLLKFRRERYGVTADIEKAFLNLLIRSADRDAMRFFFPVDIFDPSSRMKIFRYKVVMFGASCSPFLLAAVIQIHLEQHVQDRVLQESLKCIFVDNLLTSKKTEEELIVLFHGARRIFKDMGLNIRQWSSNSNKLVALAKTEGINDISEEVKVLGYLWNPIKDEFSYKTELKCYDKYTKRVVLKFGNQIIDSFGLILPIEMRYRVFLVKLWETNYDWDTSFHKDKTLVKEWDGIVEDLKMALTVRFPRTIETFINIELHLFSDASFEAYGCMAYFVIPQCIRFPQGLTQLRFCKGKVCSAKKRPATDTIPRLELMGLMMSAHAAANLMDAYSDVNFTRKVLWSDSKTALAQCSALSNKTNFVHNRVVKIRSLCKNFELRYVSTFLNPADYITKPIKIQKFLKSDLWWKGPQFLTSKDKWENEGEFNLHPDLSKDPPSEWPISVKFATIEINTMVGAVEATVTEEYEKLKPRDRKIWKYSNYKQLIHFFIGLNLIKKWIKTRETRIKSPITAKDFADGERLAIRTMQREAFPNELELLESNQRVTGKKGEYTQLKLYLDNHGIIRLHGRLTDESLLTANRPILFAYNHPLTISYILNRHKCLNCSSVTYTLNQIRRDIHSPKLRKLIRQLINKCLTCRRLLERPFKYPEHPPLNDYRSKCSRPFSMVGLDYIGPFTIRTSKENVEKENNKVWIVLFSCLVSRAIYIVLVTDRRTETFLRAIRELSARHTEPRMFISDNEGAFRASEKVLRRLAEAPRVVSELESKDITWKFLPSRASWMGGVYERLVAIIKIELSKLQGKTKFTIEEWRSHLVEVEAIVNDRPLTYVSDVGSEPEVITPHAILHGCVSETTLATDLNIDEAILNMKEYQNDPEGLYREKIALKDKFWKRVRDDYIIALRSSKYKNSNSAGRYSKHIPEVGNVVSIHDSSSKLGGRLAVITKLIPSADGEIRNAEVRTTIPSPRISLTKNYKIVHKIKAICQLLPLELKVELDEIIELPNQNSKNISNQSSQSVSGSRNSHIIKSDTNLVGKSPNLCETEPVEVSESIIPADTEEPPSDPCMSPDCVRPSPDEIDGLTWIKCVSKKCKKWFHFECVDGIKKGEDYSEVVFACKKCYGPHEEPNNFLGFTESLQNGRIIRGAAQKSRALWLNKVANGDV